MLKDLKTLAGYPRPKEVIKDVLLDVLRKASPDTNTTPVKQAFILLATFQDLRNSASGSLDDWLDPMTETFNPRMDNASPQQSGRDTVSRKSYFDSVQEQMELEGAALAEELARAGF